MRLETVTIQMLYPHALPTAPVIFVDDLIEPHSAPLPSAQRQPLDADLDATTYTAGVYPDAWYQVRAEDAHAFSSPLRVRRDDVLPWRTLFGM